LAWGSLEVGRGLQGSVEGVDFVCDKQVEVSSVMVRPRVTANERRRCGRGFTMTPVRGWVMDAETMGQCD
jgi:hypothetical protein